MKMRVGAACYRVGFGLWVLLAAAPMAQTPAKPAKPVADPAIVAALLQAPDLQGRAAWLDAHPNDVTDALRRGLTVAAEDLRRDGKLDDSLMVCKTERLVAERLKDVPALVSADFGIAQANSLIGDFEAALMALHDAQDLARSIHNETLERQTLGNLAIIYRQLGNLDQALTLQQQVLQSAEVAHVDAEVARTLNNISIIQEQRGEYRDALAAAQRALSLETPGSTAYVRSLTAIGNIYSSQHDLDLAIDTYRQALAQQEQTATSRVTTMGMLGETERQRHNYDAAENYLTQALALSESTHQQPLLAFMLRIESLVKSDRGDKAAAIPLMERSLAISRSLGNPDILSYTLTNLASLRRETGDPAAALALSREAIALGESQPSRGLAYAYYMAGEANVALGRRDEARQELESAIAIIEDLRDQVSGGGLEREQFLEGSLAPYHAMMALLLDEGANDAALQLAERTRARALLDELQRGHVDLAHSLTPEERNQEGAIERKLHTAKGKTAREQARNDLAAWRTRLFAVHPELRLARGAAEIPTPSQLREIAGDPATVVLAYAAVENHTWLFVITGDPASPLAVHKISIDNARLSTLVHKLRDEVASRSLEFASDAQGLYGELLSMAAPALRHAKRVIVIPDGVLWDLPFQILPPPDAPCLGPHYLIERASVEYAPSLTFLWEARHARTTAPRDGRRELLALGNPASISPALPQSQAQAQAISRLYGPARTTLLLGASASEQRVKADAGQYRVLHFATHGVLDDRDPMYSALLLAHAPTRDAEDGRLEARELMDLHLNADLVVLSACDTARGRYAQGEGLLGLSWAILLAGSRDVVVSQWSVDDSSTSQLMIAFHRALVRQHAHADVGVALQRAARQVMLNPRYRHPFYWAAFRTVGLGH